MTLWVITHVNPCRKWCMVAIALQSEQLTARRKSISQCIPTCITALTLRRHFFPSFPPSLLLHVDTIMKNTVWLMTLIQCGVRNTACQCESVGLYTHVSDTSHMIQVKLTVCMYVAKSRPSIPSQSHPSWRIRTGERERVHVHTWHVLLYANIGICLLLPSNQG